MMRKVRGKRPATTTGLPAEPEKVAPGLQRKTKLLAGCFRRTAQLRQNFFFAKDEIFLVLDLDFRTAVLAEEDTITGLDVQRDQFALLALASADGDDFAFHRLFFCGVRDDDATLDGFLLFYSLHDDTVGERGQLHCHLEKPP